MKSVILAVLVAFTLTACGPQTEPEDMPKSTKEQGNTVQKSSK